MPSRTFCVVGAGMAGGRAARSLRDRGFEGRILLLGEEAEPPYERPPLSKAFLTGGLAADKLYLQPAATYAELGIEWRASVAVTELDPGRSRLRLSNGETLGFDRLLLATGSRPRTLALPGAGLPGVLSYRTLSDAESLREALQHRPQVVVVGGGFLGSELAAAARQQGCPVTLVEAGPALLAPLGPLVGAFCTGLHRDAGVELLVGAAPVGFLGGSQVEQVEVEGGRLLPCDLVLVCVGAEPNVELAERAGLAVDQGVAVDQRCQSSRAGIFAAGDVASWWSPRWERRLRVEHYDNAHQQGLYVAGSMLGEQDEYDPIPYFWTEQYQAMVQQVGVIDDATRPVLRGNPASGRFSVFHLRGDRLSGCTTVNRFPDLAAARRVITAGAPIPPGLLEDQGSDLREWSQNLERG